MKRSLILVMLAAAAVLTLSTTAAPFTDQAPGMEGITLAPADGPNGIYAVETDGELGIQITEDRERLAADGISEETVTVIDNIFQIRYDGPGATRVWIETNTDDIQFHASNHETSIEGKNNNLTLTSGTAVQVGITVDTTGAHDVENITEFTVAAALPDDADDSDRPGDGSDETTNPGDDNEVGDIPDSEQDSDTDPDQTDDTNEGEVGDEIPLEELESTDIRAGDSQTEDNRIGIGDEIAVVGGGDDVSGFIETSDRPGLIEPEQTLGGFALQIFTLISAIIVGAGAFAVLRRVVEYTE